MTNNKKHNNNNNINIIYVNGSFLIESTSKINMIEQNNRTGHNSQHVDSDIFVSDKAFSVHVEASVSNDREDLSETISGDLLRGEDLCQSLREQLHHGGGIGKEKGEGVCQVILDFQTRILLCHFHSAEVAPVEREIVLN